jgi:hypothetical protein
MELNNIIHTTSGDIHDFDPDFFIAASGYETRATCVAKTVSHLDCKKIAFGFDEYLNDLSRPENDKYFKTNGFKQITQKTHGSPNFESIFSEHTSDRVHVLVDISVMTRNWYHELLKYLQGNLNFEHFHLRIMYCPAIYNEPYKLKKNISLKKFTFNDNITKRPKVKKKTALLLGLGIEKNISEKIHNIITPDQTILFYADPAIEQRYVENVFINNHGLINKTPIRFLKGFPIKDTRLMYQLLIDTILPLRQEYNIVIVPQGPKIFSLLSMIFQISYPDIDLLYPSYKIKQIQDRKPHDSFMCVDLEFDSE